MHICAELFTQYLTSKGLHYACYEGSNGDTVVDFPYQGKITKFIFNGEGTNYLSIYLVFERIPEDKFADAVFVCNELNCRYKWVTFYVDKDRDVILHDDAILSVETAADEAFELLIRIVRIGDEVKPLIMKTIYA